MEAKIAICITTHNRYDIFKRSYQRWQTFKPENATIFVVDDGSDTPCMEADYRFENAVGIAAAKNRCLILAKGFDHIFLVDDDIFPISEGWERPYINSGINHLQLSFEKNSKGQRLSHSVYKRDTVKGFDLYNAPNGVLYYFTKSAIEAVGGYDERFKTWSGEHENISRRIFNNGLTPYPFMTPVNSFDDFVVLDFYGEINSSVPTHVRQRCARENMKLVEKYKHSKEYIKL